MEWYQVYNHICDTGWAGGLTAVSSVEGEQTAKLRSQKCPAALPRLGPGGAERLRTSLQSVLVSDDKLSGSLTFFFHIGRRQGFPRQVCPWGSQH